MALGRINRNRTSPTCSRNATPIRDGTKNERKSTNLSYALRTWTRVFWSPRNAVFVSLSLSLRGPRFAIQKHVGVTDVSIRRCARLSFAVAWPGVHLRIATRTRVSKARRCNAAPAPPRYPQTRLFPDDSDYQEYGDTPEITWSMKRSPMAPSWFIEEFQHMSGRPPGGLLHKENTPSWGPLGAGKKNLTL
eukprot:6519115-Lingulodinium_polyedra.AAC.1